MKINKYGADVTSAQFKSFVRNIFEDPTEVESVHRKYSECFVKYIQEIDLELAKEILDCFKGTSLTPEQLVGTWMMECTQDYSNGIYWDSVSEIFKVHKVAETVTVTTWKPI